MKSLKLRHIRGLSNIVGAVLLISILVVILSILYLYVSRYPSAMPPQSQVSNSMLVILGVHLLPGSIVIDVRATISPVVVKYIYFFSYPDGRLVLIREPIGGPVYIKPGNVYHIEVSLLGVDISSLPPYIEIGVGTSRGGSPVIYGVPINIRAGESSLAGKSTVVFLAGRTGSGISLDPSYIHFVIVNLATGSYTFYYISGSTVKQTSGIAKILTTNILDLSKLSFSQRYALGPVVIFINPYRASQPYTITIVNIYGGKFTVTLPKLVNNPQEVLGDYLVCWEDLWWPGTTAPLDNYIDEVVRVTIFINGTVRIETIHGSGAFLHMFMLGAYSYNTILSLVKTYVTTAGCLQSTTYLNYVVFVKPHGVAYPSLSAVLWDPNTCTYISASGTLVFYR